MGDMTIGFASGAAFIIAYFVVGTIIDRIIVVSLGGDPGVVDYVFIALWPIAALVFFGALSAMLLVFTAGLFVRVVRVILAAMLVLSVSTAQAGSPCHVQQRVKAVAVVAPVAVQQVQIVRTTPLSGYYTTDQYAQPYGRAAAADSQLSDIVAELRGIREVLASQGGGINRVSALDPLSLVRKACNKCHSGDNAKAGFRTDGELSNEDRMLAIEMMLLDDTTKRMPKGSPLEPALMGKVIQQLSKRVESLPNNPPPSPEYERVE